ncbi:MAG: hypothetical protein C4536_10570 [Actinobacteria bacterium]|jgi:hypothetical protein|nr:MAG: hypothetical protein C4536_10570 [Actinomycetota bacterium]
MTRNPDQRVIFCESEGIDMLFRNIQELVKVPIDHIIIEGKRKGAYDYFHQAFSGLKGALIRTLMRRQFFKISTDMGALLGLGRLELADYAKSEYIKIYGRNVYSVPLYSGDLAGIFNFMEGLPAIVKCEEKDGGYIFTASPNSEVQEELVARLQGKAPPRQPGNTRLERCQVCSLPVVLAEYEWDQGMGTIADPATSRCMALVGPTDIDSVFRELENELGEEIPRTILEAQRRYITSAFDRGEIGKLEEYLHRHFALRGMGNLVQVVLREDSLEATVNNASPPLLVAGILQGFFELNSGSGSSCQYDKGENGTLNVEIRRD